MKFCQLDGTVLVDDAPAMDPYATMVAPPVTADAPADEPAAAETPIAEPDDILDVPSQDPMKTMVVTEEEMREALSGTAAAEPEPAAVPEPPAFEEPLVAPPPSPFSAAGEPSDPDEFERSVPPSPASDNVPMPDEALSAASGPVDVSDEPATVLQPIETPIISPPPVFQEPAAPAFDPAPVQASPAEWTPPPVPDAQWQGQQMGSNTPFQPPPPGAGGQNQTLAIISLVCGCLSLICCSWFVPGIAAVILGFIARNKATSDPANYGGAGLALAGIITGGISLVLGVIVIVLYLAGALAGSLGRF